MRGLRADSGPAAFGDWLLAGLILGSIGWTTLDLGGYPPEAMPAAATLIGLAVMLWLARAAWAGPGLWLSWGLSACLAFLGYAAINAVVVSPVRWLGWREWLGWAQMAAVFAVVAHGIRAPRARQALFWGVAMVGVVAVGMALYQRLGHPRWLMAGRVQAPQFWDRSSGPFGIPNSLAALLNLFLPAMLALALRPRASAGARIGCAYLAALFACGLVLTLSRGAWLALGGALIAWPLLARRERRRRWLGALAVTAVLAVAAGVVYWRDAGAQARVDVLLRHPVEPSRAVLWRAAWRLFAEHPVVGTGAGSFDIRFERYRPAGFPDDPQWAHNDYLNVLSNYGALGFLLACGVGVAGALRGRAALRGWTAWAGAGVEPAEIPGRALRTGIVIGLLAFALQSLVDYNWEIPALAQTAAALAGIAFAPPAAGRAEERRGPIRLPRWVPAAAAVAVAVALPGWVLPIYRAEARRHEARRVLDRLALHPPGAAEAGRELGEARELLVRAVRVDPHNAAAWSDLAATLIRLARVEPALAPTLGVAAEAAATHALEQSHAVADFWIHRGLAFDLQGRWRDAWADYVQALQLAPRRPDVWYCYAYHLSLRDLDSARDALATCLRLDPWNGPALAFQKQLGGRH